MSAVLVNLAGNPSLCRVCVPRSACWHLMRAPGVGAVVTLAYRATVDQPQRFIHASAVRAHAGLTPRRYHAADHVVRGSSGPADTEQPLVMAQSVGVAVAKRLSVNLHRMWMDGTSFRWGREPNAATLPASSSSSKRSSNRFCLGRKRSSRGRGWREIVRQKNTCAA